MGIQVIEKDRQSEYATSATSGVTGIDFSKRKLDSEYGTMNNSKEAQEDSATRH